MNITYCLCPITDQVSRGTGSLRVVSQGLSRPFLKTFADATKADQLTAPKSPRIYYAIKRVLPFQRLTHPLLEYPCAVRVLFYGNKLNARRFLYYQAPNFVISQLFLQYLGTQKSFVPLDLCFRGKFCALAICRPNKFARHANVDARIFANAKIHRWKDHGYQ